MAYTGPIPPPPAATLPASDPAWATWWAYQTALTNGRYDDERVARNVIADALNRESTAAQNARAAAEVLVAAAGQAAAAAQLAAAAAFTAPQRWTEEQLVRQFMFGLAEAGVTGGTAFLRARASMLALGDLYPPARPTPEIGPDPGPTPAPPKLESSAAEGPPGEQSLPPAEKPQVLP